MTEHETMPRYRCHKEVRAAKIVSIEPIESRFTGHYLPGACKLHFAENLDPVDVDEDWMAKHEPERGGYLAVYADGYISYSPAEPFESGYTRI